MLHINFVLVLPTSPKHCIIFADNRQEPCKQSTLWSYPSESHLADGFEDTMLF